MNYRLTIHPAIEAGNPFMTRNFETKEEMVAASDCAATLLLFMQDKAKVMDDYSNAFIHEQKIDGEWTELE